MRVAENIHQSLNETARAYAELGWSVVPLWGDTRPDQAKVAALAWAPYQRRRADAALINDWFGQRQYAGLGIVTGRISQLLVLDFDDPALIRAFENALPALAETRTVLTRRGSHLYFRVPPHIRIASRKLASADLLFEGHYVVGPPTAIDGHEYRVGRGGLPRTLDQGDADRINAFLDRYCAVKPTVRPDTPSGVSVATAGEKPQEGAFSCPHESPALPARPDDASFLTAEALVTFYRGLTRQFKRNVALFRTSCLARDHGWKYEAVVAVLAGVHASELPTGQHRRESPKARRWEAMRTIRSAFSKPPRPAQPKDSNGLFNSIREKLLQLGQTCVVRVLEGLRLAGIKAGQLINERTVLQLLKGLVGRHSVRLALTAKTPSGAPIFERRSPRYPPHRSAATPIRIDRQTNAYVNETKPDSIRGRQEIHYRIPSAQSLCQHLGVGPSGSDPIDLADLKTAKDTRQALQRALIRRRPGTYLRKWLGDRLGVSERTLSRYNAQIMDMNVVPTFTQTRLTWSNLTAIPSPESAPAGTCLEDSTGKRWPALKGIAQKLLGQGRGVKLLVRSLNYYWCGQHDPPAVGYQLERAVNVAPAVDAREPIVTFAQHIERLVRVAGSRPPELVTESPGENCSPRPITPSLPPSVHYANKRVQPRYWKPLRDDALEALAERAYTRINQLTADPDSKVSLATTRQWADTYGESHLHTALNLLETRAGVRKPAGFVATVLRSFAAR